MNVVSRFSCTDATVSEQNKNESFEESITELNSSRDGTTQQRRLAMVTPPEARLPMQNNTNVKFERPTVPLIFILGGPGSGKVTHCDNLMQERTGIVHINMTDLLQQFSIGNDMQDFSTLSSKTVTEVLMLEIKLSPSAKTYLVSGYPRSMRDVAEYSDKIQVVNGVVLINWRQKVLEKQIEYGAKLGHVVLSLAKMELRNFYKNVMPVAEYFDQSNMLVTVNGERTPEEVYKDFRATIFQILASLDNMSAAANGVTGVGLSGIPGEIVTIEPAPKNNRIDAQKPVLATIESLPNTLVQTPMNIKNERANMNPEDHKESLEVNSINRVPYVIWVIGGPGSNKAALCQRVISKHPKWAHFSLGTRLRALAETGGSRSSDEGMCRIALSEGEMVGRPLVSKILRQGIYQNTRTNIDGILIDGYPRDLEQMREFENEYDQKPNLILLDCSKLQLGRGRRDDSVAAFRRRLELFREITLPMLKELDTQHRLIIVDGDTESAATEESFERVLASEISRLKEIISEPMMIKTNGTKSNETRVGNGVTGSLMKDRNRVFYDGVENGYIGGVPN